MEKSIAELVEEIKDLAAEAPAEEAQSLLMYCIKQLKVAVIAERQQRSGSDDEEDESDDLRGDDIH